MTYTLSLGSVSSGTLRTEDLLDSFEWELSQVVKRADTDEDTSAVADLCREIGGWLALDEDERDEDKGSDLVDECFDTLNEYCPSYCYFGAHEGDGSDFGCWPMLDAMEDDLTKVSDPSELDDLPEDETEAMYVNDHGNVTLYAKHGEEWREVWSIV